MYMMNLNTVQFAAAVKNVEVAIIPVGMTEAHGQHCPLGTDTLIPRRFLQLIEAEMGSEVLIAPEIPYGHSWDLAPFPGTIDIAPEVFGEYVHQVGLGLVKWGLNKLVFFNGHGGNIPALLRVMERLTEEGASSLLINWWQDYYNEILEICEGQGHAGEDETSVILAIDDSLVDMSQANVNWNRAVATVRFPGMPLKTMVHAQTGDATLATKEKGEAILAVCTDKIIELLRTFQAGDLIEERK